MKFIREFPQGFYQTLLWRFLLEQRIGKENTFLILQDSPEIILDFIRNYTQIFSEVFFRYHPGVSPTIIQIYLPELNKELFQGVNSGILPKIIAVTILGLSSKSPNQIPLGIPSEVTVEILLKISLKIPPSSLRIPKKIFSRNCSWIFFTKISFDTLPEVDSGVFTKALLEFPPGPHSKDFSRISFLSLILPGIA